MPETKQMERELEELPSVLESLTLEGTVQLMHIYKKQLTLVQEMYNMTSHAARKAVIKKSLELPKPEACL